MADSDHQVLRVRVGTISVEKFKFNAEAKFVEKIWGSLEDPSTFNLEFEALLGVISV